MSVKKIGRYKIVEELGRGAMGVVYKASDPTIDRLVALKVVALGTQAEEGAPSPQEVFMREARAAGRLTHPAIVTVHDAFEDPETHSGCIVMEFVEGRTLEKVLLVEPALSVGRALEITRQAADALHYAHQHEVVHRDLKPANLLLTADGRVKITDFGIAKITGREGPPRTAGVVGTPSYMSPEQVIGGGVDARTDIFSLGIIQYIMLTGQKPFSGDTAAVMFKIVYEEPNPPSKLKAQLGSAHDYVVLRCLAKDRNKRYQSARELLCDLEDLQHGRPPRSQAGSPVETFASGEPTVRLGAPVIAPPPLAASPRKSASKRPMAIAVAALVILGVVLGVEFWRFRRPPAGAPVVAPTAPQPAAATPTATPPPLAEPARAKAKGAGEAATVPPAAKPGAVVDSTSAKAEGVGNAAPSQPSASPPEKPASGTGEKLREGETPRPARTESASQVPGAAAPPPVSTPAPSSRLAQTASGAASPPTPSGPPRRDQVVELLCHHDLKEGMLTISGGTRVIWEGKLSGKKRGGFFGIKGAYEDEFKRPITIPGKTTRLVVHLVAAQGIDLKASIPAAPPPGPLPALRIEISAGQLAVGWQTTVEIAH